MDEINTHPEFIKYVNRIQDKTFSETESDQEYPGHNFNITLKDKDSEGKEKYKLYKVFGKNMYSEKAPSQYQSYPPDSRSSDKYNLLVFIIMDVSIS